MNSNTQPTIATICDRWDSAERPLFKGQLINESGCCCAQGDVLRVSGYTDEQLRGLAQREADKEVAKILGISTLHSVLLRHINDKQDGCPQDVLRSPEKILGTEAKRILRFWKWLDTQPAYAYADAYADAYAAYDAVADDAAYDAAAYADDAAAAADAAYDAVYADYWFYRLVRGATLEIVGHTKLKAYYFLPIFGFENVEALDKLPGWDVFSER